jgi:hypothetical protein
MPLEPIEAPKKLCALHQVLPLSLPKTTWEIASVDSRKILKWTRGCKAFVKRNGFSRVVWTLTLDGVMRGLLEE